MNDDAIAQAHARRTELTGVTFIAVTGSCGKTTTKDLIAALLGARLRGSKNDDTRNCGPDLIRAVLAIRPDDDFFVQELGAWGPGTLDAGIGLIRPAISVITNLRNDHYSAFHGPRGAQQEKGKLVRCLPPSGTAVLNADDPLAHELAGWTEARTITYGTAEGADVRASDVTGDWPERLTFTVHHRRSSTRVRTRLLGERLLGSALAALTVALAFGLDLEEACRALSQAEPSFRRMTPVTRSDGVTFIRDDWKAPLDSVHDAFAFMRRAHADRKLAVLGTISDFPGRSRKTYAQVARDAIAIHDTTIFVGERAAELWGEHRDDEPDAQRRTRAHVTGDHDANGASLFVFEAVRDAARFLSDYLSAGDLVLLKASGPADHLERVLLDGIEPVSCWAAHCGRLFPCDMCEELRKARTPEVTAGAAR